jgi:phosphatidylethanolamine/phosphatidyl-N-methylethanolamine N-methyltransferase
VTSGGPWPKQRTSLTAEQHAALEDWYQEFLCSVLPDNFGWIERFNDRYALRSARPSCRTLEIGPGNGSHLKVEDLSAHEEYVALELRPFLSDQIAQHSNLKVVVGDCQDHLPYEEDTFDRVLAIHVLEHLDNLPVAVREVARVLKPSGLFSVVIPAEGGTAYALGRRLTVQRRFERRYKIPYQEVIRYEHINTAREVLSELRQAFRVEHRTFFPTRLPSVDLNLTIGLTLSPR